MDDRELEGNGIMHNEMGEGAKQNALNGAFCFARLWVVQYE